MYAGFIIAFIMALIASLLNEENAGSLLAGYNTMAEDKKKNVDFKAIVKLHHIVFYTIAAILAVSNLSIFFIDNEKMVPISIILTISWGLIPLFIFGKKHDKNEYKSWQKWFQLFVIALLFFGGLLLSYLIWTTPINELNL
jgi:hypothetical protein